MIEVVLYDSNWPKQFDEAAALIKLIFSDNFVAIHHIGSTAVPGLVAKPTIDILLEVKNIVSVDRCNDQMAALGYEALGENGISGRRLFIKGETNRTHHVHVFQTGNSEIARHLAFRDYLKSHPKEAEEYATLKMKLASQFAHDRQAYVKNKEAFIKALEKKAHDKLP
ncbi:MAG: glutamate-rich protein [Gammaproteobacteria bacterium]|nr:glutamate-rich protein [Gammaproteobacteria bacterium]